MFHIQENHGVIIMQKKVLLLSAVVAFSGCLLVACSDDTSANSDIIDVPAKSNAELGYSFDFKITKTCEEVSKQSLAKSSDDGVAENVDAYDDYFDRSAHESVNFYVDEDGAASFTKVMPVQCGGIVNTVEYELRNDTLHVSFHEYFWENVYDPKLGDSVWTKTGFMEATCMACDAELEVKVPPQFVGAKYLDDGLIYDIVYRKK